MLAYSSVCFGVKMQDVPWNLNAQNMSILVWIQMVQVIRRLNRCYVKRHSALEGDGGLLLNKSRMLRAGWHSKLQCTQESCLLACFLAPIILSGLSAHCNPDLLPPPHFWLILIHLSPWPWMIFLVLLPLPEHRQKEGGDLCSKYLNALVYRRTPL